MTAVAGRRGYPAYVLTALTLTYTFSLLDQGLMTLVLEPIKQDLNVTDSQLGLLTGIAFGIFYATLALPVARWADRLNRVDLAAAALALWGATVMLPMWTRGFTQLVVARMTTAIGSAGCMPPSYSLVGDYFPSPSQRTRAMAIYMLANPLSYLIGFCVGGWLNERYGWRVAFLAIGVPGLILAALIKVTVREPRMAIPLRTKESELPPPYIAQVTRVLWQGSSTRHLIFALTIVYVLGLGTLPWYAAFMIRTHHMGTAELGVWFGSIFGLGGMAGAVLGGTIAGRWLANDERAQMRFVACTIALLVPCFAMFLLAYNRTVSLVALLILMIIWNMYLGPTFAILQRLVSGRIRATALAVIMLVCNLIGMGIGPQLVGGLSDLLSPRLGAQSLRYALLLVSVSALWAAYHFWHVGRTVRRDLLAVPEDSEQLTVGTVPHAL